MIEQMTYALLNPLVQLGNKFIEIIPGLIAAVIILFVGYLIGSFVGIVVRKLVLKLDLCKWLSLKQKTKVCEHGTLAELFELITKWYIFILFLSPAAMMVKLEGLNIFLNNMAVWIPNLIAAVIVAIVGFIAAEYVAERIKDLKTIGATIIADIAKSIVLIFVAIIALGQAGIKVSVAESSFLIVLAGIMLALSLALGIGFGLGLKDDAKVWVKKLKKHL